MPSDMHTVTNKPRLCSNCVLPETFPGIEFDAECKCNFCRKHTKSPDTAAEEKKKYEMKFIDLLNESIIPMRDKDHSYDALMAYSGGKDSTYTMSLLKLKYGLNILAVSFDNGFISGAAVENIKRVTDSLGIDQIFFKPKWEVLKTIFSAAGKRELYSRKSLERASTICTTCIGLVKSICLKTAIEQNIPMIGYGWSPGQAPIQSAIMKNNPALSRMAQQSVLNPLRELVGQEIEPYFLRESHYEDAGRFPYNVHPMAWEFYNEEMILSEITKYGWKAPTDTDSNSTNCLLNAYANDIHMKRYNFHPYVWEIANMVRDGVMTRDEGYQKIYGQQDIELLSMAKTKLEK
jgi:hypothetical protein